MKKNKIRKWLPGLIALIGCTLTVLIIVLEEDDQMLVTPIIPLSVKAIVVKKTDYQIQVPAWGFVAPRETIDIHAEISGKIKDVSDNVFTGAIVKQNDLLFTIDDRDYRNRLAEAVAAKNQVQQALEIENGRQAIAKTEWTLLEQSKWQGNKNKSLALRKPQLRERKAAVQIAIARESQAALDVERTSISSPCGGVILSENLAEGQILDTGDVAMKIGCTNSYHITALFSPEYSVDSDSHTVAVNVGSNKYQGVIKAVLPQINSETRQKQVLVEFQGEGITLGGYVKIMLPGSVYNNVAILPKAALRSRNTVWILSESNTLEIRNVTVFAKDMQNVVVGEGLTETDRVILTHIATPLVGMNLLMLPQQPEYSQNIKNHGDQY